MATLFYGFAAPTDPAVLAEFPPGELLIGKSWCVTESGTASLDGRYEIAARNLRDGFDQNRSIVLAIGAQEGVDPVDLCTALFIACATHGVMLSAWQAGLLRSHALRRAGGHTKAARARQREGRKLRRRAGRDRAYH